MDDRVFGRLLIGMCLVLYGRRNARSAARGWSSTVAI